MLVVHNNMSLQYVNDMSFMIKGWLEIVRNMVDHMFCFSLGLKINKEKSATYLQTSTSDKPHMARYLPWRWVQNGKPSKLIGIAFGFSVDMHNVDDFLVNTI